MIAVFPFCAEDIQSARNLFKWIELLGGCQNHSALLVADNGVNWREFSELRDLADKSFKKVLVVVPESQVTGWPQGPNTMFRIAAEAVESSLHEPFFFCEPDCVPLKAGWLDSIEQEYLACGKPFMGCLVHSDKPSLPSVSLAGNAVYPADAASRLRAVLEAKSAMAWDVASAEVVVPQSVHSRLIQHFWGQPNLPPTFSARKFADSPINTFTLQNLHPDAVVFHRNKDGTLLRLLWSRIFPGSWASRPRDGELVIVLPFCWMDVQLLDKHLNWLNRLNGKIDRTAVLSTDDTTSSALLRKVENSARNLFSNVLMCRYPRSTIHGWPAACNWAFQHTARYMIERVGRPWFWDEADAVAVNPTWLDQLESEYFQSGKPFMGTIISTFDGLPMGHMNGVGVYPPNVAVYSSRMMTCSGQAWDTAWADEVGRPVVAQLVHRANHLIQHCGATANGKCKPANGPLPVFPRMENVSQYIEPSTVIFHPSKDGSLVDRLTERALR